MTSRVSEEKNEEDWTKKQGGGGRKIDGSDKPVTMLQSSNWP